MVCHYSLIENPEENFRHILDEAERLAIYKALDEQSTGEGGDMTYEEGSQEHIDQKIRLKESVATKNDAVS